MSSQLLQQQHFTCAAGFSSTLGPTVAAVAHQATLVPRSAMPRAEVIGPKATSWSGGTLGDADAGAAHNSFGSKSIGYWSSCAPHAASPARSATSAPL